jgi:hypothetical protein
VKISEILCELLTSKHVVKNGEVIAIMNMVEKTFGPPKQEDWWNICLIAQTFYTIQAVTDIPKEDLKKYFLALDIKGKSIERLVYIIEAIHLKPIIVDKKVYTFDVEVHKIKNAGELKTALSGGQPVIAAFDMDSGFGECMSAVEDMGEKIPYNLQNMILRFDERRDHNFAERHELIIKKLGREKVESLVKDLKNGFISETVYAVAKKYGEHASAHGVFHSIGCFGYDAKDDAFLFKDSRHSYSRQGYVKVAAKLFDKITTDKKFIQGMFYVQVNDLKIEKASEEQLDAKRRRKDEDEDDEDW